jgi:hypothetical protein
MSQLKTFFTMKSEKQPALACPIDAIGASACPMAVFSGFYEYLYLLYQVMHAV